MAGTLRPVQMAFSFRRFLNYSALPDQSTTLGTCISFSHLLLCCVCLAKINKQAIVFVSSAHEIVVHLDASKTSGELKKYPYNAFSAFGGHTVDTVLYSFQEGMKEVSRQSGKHVCLNHLFTYQAFINGSMILGYAFTESMCKTGMFRCF